MIATATTTNAAPSVPPEAEPAAPPGAPRPAPRARRLVRRPVAWPRLRRPSTPFVLRLAMALVLVPIAVVAAAVQLGAARNDSTVRTVGRDATRGITVAQAIKLNLAELDAIVVEQLLGPVTLGPGGFPEAYNTKRAQLDGNLVLAASGSSSAPAYRQPLANIDYVLAHYHTLVKEAFAAKAGGDAARSADLYDQAHEVMADTLLPAADFVDKANTYVLNNTYDTQQARSASTRRVIVVSWIVLVACLVLAQLLLARKFRRLVNLALAAATLVAIANGAFALSRLDASSSDLTRAREQAFDSVHVLARARATVVSARQAQGQFLLDESGDAEAGFTAQAAKLFRVQGRPDVAAIAKAGTVPEGAGGYLARVAGADAPGSGGAQARRALVAFGDFMSADAGMRARVQAGDAAAGKAAYQDAQAFTALTRAVDRAQVIDQATFDAEARAAADATAHVGDVNTIAAAGMAVLVLLGLYQRLREYRI